MACEEQVQRCVQRSQPPTTGGAVQDRPPFEGDMLTWQDHACDELYVPPILNATAVTVPGWIYNATAA